MSLCEEITPLTLRNGKITGVSQVQGLRLTDWQEHVQRHVGQVFTWM